MTAKEVIKVGEDLCRMIFDLASQPRLSEGEAYRINSLGCDISSALNLIAAIDADSKYFSKEDDKS